MKSKPTVSIVIATYNSGKILPKVLDSIQKQTYPRSKIEILVIDGGSTDDTVYIAQKFGCFIIANPKTLPAWAKYIGYKAARGKYIMYLDSDEVIKNNSSIERKIQVLETNKRVKAVTGSGYVSPSGVSFLNDYVNEFGDPFSYFYYKLSKDHRFFIPSIKYKYVITDDTHDHVLVDFSKSIERPIFELVAMGSIVDLAYCKKNFPNIVKEPGLIPHIFNLLVSKQSQVAIIKKDPLVHYTSTTVKSYLRKITSRVMSNVFTKAADGFKGRSELEEKTVRYKKYVFIPYALSVIFPLLDSLYLSVTRRNLGYLVHVPLCLYTVLLIMFYAGVRVVGITPSLKSYGGVTPVTK
jgi:glycosyltransferase involved in cell wall biosynthesis